MAVFNSAVTFAPQIGSSQSSAIMNKKHHKDEYLGDEYLGMNHSSGGVSVIVSACLSSSPDTLIGAM